MGILYRIIRVAVIFFILLGIVSLFFFNLVDNTPYKETAHYQKTLSAFDTMVRGTLKVSGDTTKVGWARASLVPRYRLPLAGHGDRNGAMHEGVNDSTWAKAIVLNNGSKQVAYVSLDLLIVPMELVRLLPNAIDSMGLDMEDLYLTATHTHNSIGGWAQGTGGEFFAGKYQPQVKMFMAQAIAKAIYKALGTMEPCKIGYSAVHAADQVTNRLVGDMKGGIDPWVRFVKFQKADGQTAILATFAAHATCLPSDFMKISGDYPGALCTTLERAENIDFAIFSAGAVASMGPLTTKQGGLEKVKDMSENLAEQVRLVQNFTPVHHDPVLGALNIDLHLGEPQWRISNGIRVRPWVFKRLFGAPPAKITSLLIGNILFIGTPCDFSGELVSDIEQYARSKNIHVIITSFNGGYSGYITKDEWYDLNKYETRMMNWYGPNNGSYFTEVIKKIVDIYAEDN